MKDGKFVIGFIGMSMAQWKAWLGSLSSFHNEPL
jgi:hypothetical protein